MPNGGGWPDSGRSAIASSPPFLKPPPGYTETHKQSPVELSKRSTPSKAHCSLSLRTHEIHLWNQWLRQIERWVNDSAGRVGVAVSVVGQTLKDEARVDDPGASPDPESANYAYGPDVSVKSAHRRFSSRTLAGRRFSQGSGPAHQLCFAGRMSFLCRNRRPRGMGIDECTVSGWYFIPLQFRLCHEQ